MDLIVVYSFLPELFLSFCILFQLLFNSYLITSVKLNSPIITTETFWQTLFILVCVFLLLFNCKIKGYFSNLIFSDDFSTNYIKIISLITSFFLLFIIIRNFRIQKLNFFEYFTIFLLSLLSLLLLISSCDMISAYLVIEMQALGFYILSSFRRDSAFSTEAGLKYFISGSFISCIFLFGCSAIYGGLGTLNLNSIQLLLYFPFNEQYTFLYFFIFLGILLITITFLFKLSVAPFHFWSPDVYEGAPLATTSIFSILPKFGLVSFFIKWLSVVYPIFLEISTFLLFVGVLSIFFGTFFAIFQKRLKRLIIYSSIAQTGFIIVALSQNNVNSFSAVYFFIIIYILTSLLIWSHFSLFYSFQNKINIFYNKPFSPLYFSSLSNLFKFNKLWAFSFVLIFFSIAGIPPLSGFFAKVLILFSIIESVPLIVPLILVLISAISVFYYLRVIKTVFFESNVILQKKEDSQIVFSSLFLFLDCLIISFFLFLLVFFFFYPSYILMISSQIVLGSPIF